MAYRIDRGSLRKPERLPDGRLRADGWVTRSGVFDYVNADGSLRREYRPPDEVFRADSLRSFADVVVTDDHPAVLVDATNARQFAVGHVSGEPRRDGDKVAATIVVIDAAVIAKLEAGKVALSCGYEVDLDATPGTTPDGERYDAIQRNIRGNHVAIVDVGRAGPDARLRMDAAVGDCGIMVDVSPTSEPTVNLEQALAALAAANEKIGALTARADAADAQVAELTKSTAKLEGDLAAAAARADAAEKARTDAAAALPGAVKARVSLLTAARAALGADVKLDEMSDREIKCAVVKRVDSFEIPADAADAYVDGRFESAVGRADKGAESLATAREALAAGRADASNSGDPIALERAARAKHNEWSRNAWKGADKA